MSLLIKGGGITKLSELTIDADKNWAAMGISNIKELAAAMQKGDFLYKGPGGILVKLSPGPIGDELTSQGLGHDIWWQPPPSV